MSRANDARATSSANGRVAFCVDGGATSSAHGRAASCAGDRATSRANGRDGRATSSASDGAAPDTCVSDVCVEPTPVPLPVQTLMPLPVPTAVPHPAPAIVPLLEPTAVTVVPLPMPVTEPFPTRMPATSVSSRRRRTAKCGGVSVPWARRLTRYRAGHRHSHATRASSHKKSTPVGLVRSRGRSAPIDSGALSRS